MDITEELDERLLVGWAELAIRAKVETPEDLEEEGTEEAEEKEKEMRTKIEWYKSERDT